MTDYTLDPYRSTRWDNNEEARVVGAAPRDDDNGDGGDRGDGAGPLRATDEAGPSGTTEEMRGHVTRARRLRIIERHKGVTPPTKGGTQAPIVEAVTEEVLEEEAPRVGGKPRAETITQAEEPAAVAGTTDIRRLVEAMVREMFPQVYAEGQPTI